MNMMKKNRRRKEKEIFSIMENFFQSWTTALFCELIFVVVRAFSFSF